MMFKSNYKSKCISLILVVALVITMIPVNAFASETTVVASGDCGDNLNWELDSNGKLKIIGEGAMDNYSTSNVAPWNEYSSEIVSVEFDDDITAIGNYAFDNYSNIICELNLPEKLTKIGTYAFRNCSGLYGKLEIPDAVTSIGWDAFSGCSNFTGDLIIPDSVVSIGSSAFFECSGFTGNLIISEGVTKIGSYAFSKCSGFTGDLIIPDSVTSIDVSAFSNCNGFNGTLAISENLTSIKQYVFYNCSGFTGELIIPENVTSIGLSAFDNCSGFTGELIIPKNITSIGMSAFNNCSGFTGELIIPENVSSIEMYTFAGCKGLEGNLIIPSNVTSVGSHAFNGCEGFSGVVIIPDSVLSIGDCAFNNTFFSKMEILNESCDIYDSAKVFPATLLLSGYNGSTIQTYAETYSRKFEIIPCKEHVWDEEYTIDIEATCTKEGSKSIHCSNCNEVKDVEVIEKVDHAYGEWVVYTEATCTMVGSKHKECKCGDTVEEEIPVLGHNYSTEWTVDVEPTCMEAGSKSHHCTRCEAKTDVTVVSASGHTYGDWVVDTKATCTTEGSQYKECICGEKITESIPVLNHNYSTEWTVDVEPTCTEKGSKSRHCTRCEEKIDITTISANGHTYGEWIEDTKATCTTVGLQHKECECGDKVEEEIPVLGHNYSTEWTIDAEPTCTTAGRKSHHCTRCESKADVTPISANGHTYGNWVVDTEATCSTTGLKHKECACGDKVQEELPVLEHNYSTEWTVDVEPTCTEKGSKSHHCRRCGAKTDVTPISANGHIEIKDNAVKATCTTTGLTEGKHCSVCNKILVEQEVTSALGHKYGSTLTQKATVSKNGEIYKKCSVCNTTETVSTIYYPKTIKLSSTKYTYNGKLKKPTVTVKDSNGKTISTSNYTVTYPKGMKNIGKYTVTVKFKGSKYSGTQKLTYTIVPKTTKVKSVTTILSGKTTVKWNTTSGVTGYQLRYSTNSDMSSSKTKTYSGKNKNSAKLTGLTSGTKYYIQIRTYKTVSGTKYYSNWSNKITAKAPVFSLNKSTIQKGTTCYITLSNIKSSDTVKSWKSSNTSVATIKKVSKTKYKVTPKKCGITTISVKVNGTTVKYKVTVSHKKVTVKGKAATCTSTGLTTGSKCSVCGKVLEAQTKIAVKGHNYSTEWTVDVKPTCTEKGSKSRHCTRCKAKTGVTAIAANGHTVVIDAAVAPTATATGLSEGSHCSVCGKVIVPQEVIPKLSPAQLSSFTYTSNLSSTYGYYNSRLEAYTKAKVENVECSLTDTNTGKVQVKIKLLVKKVYQGDTSLDNIKFSYNLYRDGVGVHSGNVTILNTELDTLYEYTITYTGEAGNYTMSCKSYY